MIDAMGAPSGSWCDPLPAEEPLAFLAFRFYRDLWPATRGLEDVALELGVSNEAITLAACRSWAELYRWNERAAEYDAWVDQRSIARREQVKDMRERLTDHEGLIGLSFLQAAGKAGARMARNGDDLSAPDAIRLARAGRELLIQDGAAGGETQSLGDRLEELDSDKLETLIGILGEAGIDLDEI